MKVNFKQAQTAIAEFNSAKKARINPPNLFYKYSPSYIMSNEDLRWITKIKHTDGGRVLTTCGSGDQAIFYTIAGASVIDTFDISYCAKIAMDIKTSAIKSLYRCEYNKLIDDLHCAPKISDVKNMKNIIKKLPPDSKKFLNKMDELNIFSNGRTPHIYKEYLPDENEYNIMQKKINEPFNFIWTDICNLHKKINCIYDTINFSNIFQYTENTCDIAKILENMAPHLSDSGKIIVDSCWHFLESDIEKYRNVSEKVKDWADIGLIDSKKNQVIILIKKQR